jgi:GMP synthase (glutamine-hydrolysing)
MPASSVLVFRHVPFEDIGLIRPALEESGISIEYADLERKATPPDITRFAGLIFMGGPMCANDDLPYLRHELALIRQAAERSQPVLGVCLGAQLMAKALGARVYPNPVKEIGWFDVHRTPAGAEDPLLSEFHSPEPVFQWHRDTFDLPGGATRLAYSDACINQAFRIGTHMYGLQFHLEVTPAMIADWCDQDINCGDVRELTCPIDSNRNSARLRTLAGSVFGNWCKLL